MTQQHDHHGHERASTLSTGVKWSHLALLGTVLLTYGFELFNFNVSVDEPLYWNMSRVEMLEVWSNQGRWGMGLAALLLPSTNVPLVPLALGLALSVAAFWWTARRVFDLTEWESALAVSLAMSLPALVFHFSFMINALGVGIAYAACAGCAAVLMTRHTPLSTVAATALGAVAIGVYESFAFVLGVTLLALIWRSPKLSTVLRCAAVAVGATVTWFLVRYVFILALPREGGNYVTSMVDVNGAVADPVTRVVDAASRTFGIIVERWLYLGYSNPLPAIFVGIVFIAGVRVAWSRTATARLWSMLVLIALPIIPFVAAVMTRVIFQRSMVYLPLIVVMVLGVGLPAMRDRYRSWAGHAMVVLAILAVAGNASLGNGIFYSGTMVYEEDLAVAANVATTYRSLPGDFTAPLPAVIAPRSDEYSRPPAWSGRSTFEAGVMGTDGEALRFLQMRGMNVVDPSSDELERGHELLQSMPAYPEPGYMQVSEGLLLINLETVAER
ncbi:glucosyltransferase domain-containing protein [Nocardioides baculatus]|uniref:Glucosyltransferase domain-containing protein n=1 Tax=Nocardioides baculatus TaxID=2801337 RepID=A0ABS1LC73_9ACTN|nr:glucosyltransferase domain-containing protein [Nocardioides baculatus]MBL0749142.1 glucosyltransferase domain-containing protein [Nocardioides baculatus]